MRTNPFKRIIIGGCLGLCVLAGILVLRELGSESRPYSAEALFVLRPFTNALLGRVFERDVRLANPGITRLAVQVSTWTSTTRTGTTRETNAFVRLVTAGATVADAERLARDASDRVRSMIRQKYGIDSNPIGHVYGAPSSAFHEPFRLRFGSAAQIYFPTAGRVFFPGAAISIDPGPGWRRYYMLQGIHSPQPESESLLTLVGRGKLNGGFIYAHTLRSDATNIESGLVEIRNAARVQNGFIESSWKEEPFMTDGGLAGVHTCFTGRYPSPTPGGADLTTQTIHEYLVTNAQSRCICIQFLIASSSARPKETISAAQSEEIQRVIRRTLRVQ